MPHDLWPILLIFRMYSLGLTLEFSGMVGMRGVIDR